MKKFIFLIPAALCIIIASCSKDSGLDPGKGLSPGFDKGFKPCVPPITYSPSADGDDTDELKALISGAEPGSVIKLSQGEYHLGYMELYGFNGSLVGAGKEKTKIILKPSIDQLSQLDENKTPGWWRLIGGDITLSDITFLTPDGFLSDEEDYDTSIGSDLYSMFMVNNYNDEYYHPDGPPQKLLVKNCSFIGGTNKDMSKDMYWVTEHNTWLAFWIGVDYIWPKDDVNYPLTKGDYVFKECYFDNFLDGAEGFSLGENATFTVTGCRLNKCKIPLFFIANYNSCISITNNIFTGSQQYDIFIEDIDAGFLSNTEINPIRRCSYVITGNQFNTRQVSSIVLCDTWIGTDPTQRLPMLFTIKGNLFNLNGSDCCITALNSQDPVIRNNRFTGTCETGVYINGGITQDLFGIVTVPNIVCAKNALILGNNFSGLKATNAAVVLGDKTMNCTVIGTGKEKVVDDGINNKVTGMKKVPGGHHFGPLIRDNVRTWRGRDQL